MKDHRPRILENGIAFWGPDDAPELKESKEKVISDWTDEDLNTMKTLVDALKRAKDEGQSFDSLTVTPMQKDKEYESQVQYRRKGLDEDWNSLIVRNRNEITLNNLEPDTEYEVRVRNRFIESDRKTGDWHDWQYLEPFKTKTTEKEMA